MTGLRLAALHGLARDRAEMPGWRGGVYAEVLGVHGGAGKSVP